MTLLEDLADRWEADADLLRKHGAVEAASTAELHAAQLRETLREEAFEAVTLEEASDLGGFSYSHLQRLVSGGTIANVGEKHAPRIRRTDVPVKPGHGNRTEASRSEVLDRTLSLHRGGLAR